MPPFGPNNSVKTFSTVVLTSKGLAHRSLGELFRSPTTPLKLDQLVTFADETNDFWGHLKEHFALFAREPLFPALKKVILHGDWDAVRGDARFEGVLQQVLDRGLVVEYEQQL